MTQMQSLKLGTRRSLLAWAQSGWVAREIERLNPGTKVELVGIETRGDKIQDVSLQKVEGKDFFVAELDDAIRSGRVDLTVHSMKDLSLERPKEIVLAAVPRRENPRDVILMGPGGLRNLREGRKIRIGTSSPRRLENIPSFLKQALPRFGDPNREPELEFREIRGNVNTRLGRVHEPDGSERYLDGVVLAFAGLIRLQADAQARIELARLLQGVRWLVLPLAECPTNPGQGALAVECRGADGRVREMLARLHDPETARHASRERALLGEWGGGCHQRFGGTSFCHPEAGDLFYVRGMRPDGIYVDEIRWSGLEPAPRSARPWDGSEVRGDSHALQPASSAAAQDLAKAGNSPAVFVAHSRAVHGDGLITALRGARVWVSGSRSWFALARQGIWVEGSAENLGFDWLAPELKQSVLGLPALEEWRVLTHDTAAADWAEWTSRVHATYRSVKSAPSEAELKGLRQATHVYWSSGSQWEALGSEVPQGASHACGPGKTARLLKKRGLSPRVFPSTKEWKKWVGIKG